MKSLIAGINWPSRVIKRCQNYALAGTHEAIEIHEYLFKLSEHA